MEHRSDAALCQHLLRSAQVPVGVLVGCAEAQRAAKRAGAPVPYLWELLAARRVLSAEQLSAARRAIGDVERAGAAPRAHLSPPLERAPVRSRQDDPEATQTHAPEPVSSAAPASFGESGEFLPGWGTLEREGVARGDVLADFELEEPIGRGSMGSVFAARDRRSGRRVALKVLAGERARSAAGTTRFHHEARLLCSLRHEHLVHGLAFGTDRGRPFLVMELVEGPSLKHLVRSGGPLSSREAAKLGLGLARALAYLHGEGIVHRDIKPANVLIGRDGRPRLCDLGLARDEHLPSEATSSSDTLGTPCYMAPEQARGPRAAGPSADLYSLGVTLFHAVAGRPPFVEESGIVVLSRHLFDGIPDVRTLRPDADPRLARTIFRLTRKHASERIASAGELAGALHAILRPAALAA